MIAVYVFIMKRDVLGDSHFTGLTGGLLLLLLLIISAARGHVRMINIISAVCRCASLPKIADLRCVDGF